MGSSSYNSSDRLRGSSTRRSRLDKKTPLENVIKELGDFECDRRKLAEAKKVLEKAEYDLDEAQAELEESEKKVREQLDKLDPETQNTLKRMLFSLDEKDSKLRDDR